MGSFLEASHARGVLRGAADAIGDGPGAAVTDAELAPISGISLERYAQLSRALGERGLDASAVAAFLAGQGHTRLEWQTAAEGWDARMRANAALSSRFAAFYERGPAR